MRWPRPPCGPSSGCAAWPPRSPRPRRTTSCRSRWPTTSSGGQPAPGRLEQALANLVDNALSYGEGAVALTARRENGTVELHVRDEGEGFPPAFLPHAFERFSRADQARGGGSAGLGLAIAS